jgi:hypothetical protein
MSSNKLGYLHIEVGRPAGGAVCGFGKDVVLCSAPPNGCSNTTSHLEIKSKSSGDQVVGRQ